MSWNRGDTTPKKVVKKAGLSPIAKGGIAGLLVVLGVVCYFWISGGGEKPVKKVVKGRAPVKAATQTEVPKLVKTAPAQTNAVPKRKKTKEEIAAIKAEAIRRRHAEQKEKQKQQGIITLPPSDPNRPFNNPSDQVLSMVAAQENGMDAPPMPISDSMDADFKKSLELPVIINDDDPESVKAMKQAVMALREDMKEMMKDGRSAKDILVEHQKMLAENAKMRYKAMKELQSLVDEGDAEMAATYMTKANEIFEQMGVKPLEIPLSTEERRQQALERVAARMAAQAAGQNNTQPENK